MKIALATNDRKNIALRTGRAKEFAIYNIEDGKTINVDFKVNTHKHDHHKDENGEEHEHSHKEIIDLLRGVDILLVRAIGKHFKRDVISAGINYKVIKIENIEEALRSFEF